MFLVKGQNINDIQLSLLEKIKTQGRIINVRGDKTMEIFPVSIQLNNPKNRITTLISRNWNLPFAIGEMCWHFSASNNFDFIKYYSKNWILAKEDYENSIRESCYGKTIFSDQTNQWSKLIYELKEDLNSRRAVLNLYNSATSLGQKRKDVACTSTIQYLIRQNKLDCIVTMRSNDLIWGLPNDIFFFTMLQERLSLELGVELGVYYHNVGSMHVYDRHFDMMKSILDHPKYLNFSMPKMRNVEDISKLLQIEEQLRRGIQPTIEISGYWKELAEILKLRSDRINRVGKLKLLSMSSYKDVLKLCPNEYIFNNSNSYV